MIGSLVGQSPVLARSRLVVARKVNLDEWTNALKVGEPLELKDLAKLACGLQFTHDSTRLVICDRGDGATDTRPDDTATRRPSLAVWDLQNRKLIGRWSIHSGVS